MTKNIDFARSVARSVVRIAALLLVEKLTDFYRFWGNSEFVTVARTYSGRVRASANGHGLAFL